MASPQCHLPGFPSNEFANNELGKAVLLEDDPQHHWFKEPTEPVGPKFVTGIFVAQTLFFVALLGPAIVGVAVKVNQIVPTAERTSALALVAGVGAALPSSAMWCSGDCRITPRPGSADDGRGSLAAQWR